MLLLWLLLFPLLTDSTPVVLPAPSQPPTPSATLCALPEYLGYAGHGKSIIDCDTLDRYREPPSSVYSWGGNHPKVCCPDPVGLCFPGEPCSDNPKVYEDYEYEGGDYDYNPSIVFDGEGICQNGTSCTEISSCGAADFVGNSSPSYCGRTEDGQDKICCKGQGGSPKIPQPALFLDKKKQIYECLDQTEFCEKWLRLNPQSCSSGHPSYPFMREACYKTCNRCGSDGCVDNYKNCPQWSVAGECSINPQFMVFNCRESCGTCGFKSPFNKENQEKDGQFTDMNRSDFICGKGKSKKSIDITNVVKTTGVKDVEFEPYSFADEVDDNTNKRGVCTSAMISDRFVVTAAHCVSEFTDAQKRELTRTIVIRDDTQFEEIFEVKRHFLHPMYRFPLLYNDVAVFELERKIVYDFDKYGDSPVCLGQDFDIQNQKALAQGFGKTEDDILPDTLLETFVQTVSNQECRDWINYNLTIFPKVKKGVTNSYSLGINDALLCTVGIYNPDKEIYSGPCPGDSGGPLYLNKVDNGNGIYEGQTLIGIHSGGFTCGHKNAPHTWQRMAFYAPWIKCIKENAEKNQLSKVEINRICFDLVTDLKFVPFDLE